MDIKNWTIKKISIIAVSIVSLIVLISYSGKMFEEVGAGEVVVIQHPISGELDVITTPGTYSQYLGTAVHYKKRSNIGSLKIQIKVILQTIQLKFDLMMVVMRKYQVQYQWNYL